jgi:hypothetical protein
VEILLFRYTNTKLKRCIEYSLKKKRWAPVRGALERIQRRDCSNILSKTETQRQLREWYESLVGGDLNLTSLSLLSMPAEDRVCAYYWATQGQHAVSRPWPNWHWEDQKVGWLGTGDAMLKQRDLADEFLGRFGESGSGRIACMSLPHHGSARNHNGTVLDRIDPEVTFATCPLKKSVHHPSPNVERAVRARGGRLIKVTEQESSLLCEHVRVLLD